MSELVSLYAEFTALPAHQREVNLMVKQLVHDVRSEPGNLVFQAWCRREQPQTFVVFETYRDQEAFDAHISSVHSLEFNRLLAPLVKGGGSRLTWLTPVGQ